MEFFEFVVQDGKRKQVEVEVPFFGVSTTTKQVPGVVGIPLFGDQLPREHFWKLVKVIKSLKARVMAEGANVMLSLRSYVAYALSKLDSVGAGVQIGERTLEPVEKATRAYYRAAMGLGPWVRKKYLTLP